MLLGLDPSTTRFGVAIGSDRSPNPTSYSWRLPGAGDHVFDQTLVRVSESLEELLKAFEFTHAVIEAPIIIADRSAHTMACLMQLTGAVRAMVARAGCRVHLVGSSTVRKHFVGSGRPDNAKCAVMDRCKLLGWNVSDDNAADACAVWCWGMSTFFPKWSPNGTPLFAGAGA